MKKITFIRFLALLILLLNTTIGVSQTIVANLIPSNSTACPPAGCTANDVKIGEVYIADSNGNRLTTCNSGTPISGQYLWVRITDASSKYGLYMQFNMYKGTDEIDQNGNVISDGNTKKITVGDNRQIAIGNYRMMPLPSYTCGDFLTLKDIYLAWQTPPGGQATTVTPECASTSKCSAENLPNTIIVNTPLAVDFTYIPNCTGNTYQQVTFTNISTGGDGTLTYLWNFGAGATPSTSIMSGKSPNSITVNYSSGGSKTVSLKITDSDGDNDTETKSITVESCCTIAINSITKTNVTCNGASNGTVTATKTGGTGTITYDLLYSATSGGSFSPTGLPTNGDSNGVYTGLGVGFYKVKVTEANGCSVTSSEVQITHPTSLTASISAQTNVKCFGDSTGSVTVAGANGTAPYTYAINGGTFANSGTFSSLTAGDYTVTVKDANDCTTTQAVSITQPNAALTASVSAQTNVKCFGDSTGSVTVAGANGTAPYTYAINGGTFANSGTFSSLTAGDYTVTVKDANDCTTTQAVSITQPEIAVSVSGIATNASCFGEADGSIAVTNSAGSTVVITDSNDQVVSNTGLKAGTYTLTATAAGGNDNQTCTATATVTITQPEIAISVSGIATNASCFGEADGSIAVTNSPGSTVVITDSNDQVVSNTGLKAGTYTLTATAAGGNDNQTCTATATVTITQPEIAVSVSGIATNASCFGEADGSIAVTNSAGSTVVITNSNNEVVSNTGLKAGTYTLTATAAGGNAEQTCTATAQVTITQPTSALSATATIVNNNNCVGCSNGSINLTVQGGTAPYTYTWSNGAITEDISGLPKGQYNVTISDKNSCSVTYTYYITESGIELLKDAVYVDSNNDGKTNIGDNIVYNFVVKNTGNVTLTNVSITDNKATVTGGPIATLEAGASDSTTFTATHAITQDDINRGVFYNLALANAKDSENINVNDTSSDPTPCTTCTKDPECTDCTITVLPQTPELTVDKTAVVNTRDTTSDVYTFVGDVINYTITVTNTGNVSIYNVVVKDPLTGLDTTNEPFVLNPGESKEFTQSHTITLADLQVDSITNIATANGVTLGNTPVEGEDSVIVEKAGVLGCGTILVHNAFTPNNDNINEVFKIDNIDDTLCYPENSVEIYNRWGILVYETKGYNNEDKAFKGFSEGRVTVDKSAGLPDGTYFYILNYTSVGLQGEITANKKQGYLYLTR